jgi:hypothetical protein
MPRKKGSGNRISCSFDTTLDGAPDSIMYFPEGTHTIQAKKNGKPAVVTVKVDASVLASFQSGLSDRIDRKGARPILDFDHLGKGKASALPKAFRYEPGVGLFLDVEWTSAGRTAIEGKEYSYFSPDFLLGADGTPTGIPMRGPVGSLVNDPAFETIQRIAASDTNEDNPHESMSILNNIGLLSENEAAKEDAEQVAAARIKAFKDEPASVQAAAVTSLQATINDALKAVDGDAEAVGVSAALAPDATVETVGKVFGSLIVACAQSVKSAADAKVEAAKATAQASVDALVSAGKIPAKNEDLKTFWLGQFASDPEAAAKVTASMPQIAPGLTTKELDASVSAADTTDLDAAAEKLVADGTCTTISAARVEALTKNPELYEQYQIANGLER